MSPAALRGTSQRRWAAREFGLMQHTQLSRETSALL